MKYVGLLLGALLYCVPAFAQTYPTCPATGTVTSCTMTIHVTSTATPIFAKQASRQYLFLQNTGYIFSSSVPVLSQLPVFCAIGSNNQPIANTAGTSNVIALQPGGTYEPSQIVKAQAGFVVPPADVSCIAPFGDVWLTAEQE